MLFLNLVSKYLLNWNIDMSKQCIYFWRNIGTMPILSLFNYKKIKGNTDCTMENFIYECTQKTCIPDKKYDKILKLYR